MSNYDASKPLISIHVPKCAGTSLRDILAGWFGSGFHDHYQDERTGTPPPVHPLWDEGGVPRQQHPVCVHGHFNAARGIGVEQYYPHADQLVTVLRDPFEVRVSNYFFVRTSAEQGWPGALRDGAPHDIIRHRWSLRDWLSRLHGSMFLPFLPAGTDATNFRQVLDERFLYVGLAEYMDQTVVDLARLLGFEQQPAPSLNVAARDERVDPELREVFAANHPLDMAIFEHVLARFRERARPGLPGSVHRSDEGG